MYACYAHACFFMCLLCVYACAYENSRLKIARHPICRNWRPLAASSCGRPSVVMVIISYLYTIYHPNHLSIHQFSTQPASQHPSTPPPPPLTHTHTHTHTQRHTPGTAGWSTTRPCACDRTGASQHSSHCTHTHTHTRTHARTHTGRQTGCISTVRS